MMPIIREALASIALDYDTWSYAEGEHCPNCNLGKEEIVTNGWVLACHTCGWEQRLDEKCKEIHEN
jgi:hypothetical protein